MKKSAEIPLSTDNWFELRELVLSAHHENKLKVPSFSGYEDFVEKIKIYLETGDKVVLNQVAQQVANLKAGASSEGKNTPWVLLEKS